MNKKEESSKVKQLQQLHELTAELLIEKYMKSGMITPDYDLPLSLSLLNTIFKLQINYLSKMD